MWNSLYTPWDVSDIIVKVKLDITDRWRRKSWRGIESLGKCEIGFVFLFTKMLLSVLGCIDFTMSLSKNLMWHVLIGWCKPKGLHFVLIEFNLLKIYIYSQLCYVHALYTIIQLEVIFYTIPNLKFLMYKSISIEDVFFLFIFYYFF